MCATPTTSVGVILPLSRVQDDYNRKLLWRFLLGWEKGLAFFFCHTNKAIWRGICWITGFKQVMTANWLQFLISELWQFWQVSFGSSSPSLSDKNRFPRFYRTIPSEIQVNSLRLAIMRTFNWTRVATLHNTENVFSVVRCCNPTSPSINSKDGIPHDRSEMCVATITYTGCQHQCCIWHMLIDVTV